MSTSAASHDDTGVSLCHAEYHLHLAAGEDASIHDDYSGFSVHQKESADETDSRTDVVLATASS